MQLCLKASSSKVEHASIQKHHSCCQYRKYGIDEPKHEGQFQHQGGASHQSVDSYSRLILRPTADIADDPPLRSLEGGAGTDEGKDGAQPGTETKILGIKIAHRLDGGPRAAAIGHILWMADFIMCGHNRIDEDTCTAISDI